MTKFIFAVAAIAAAVSANAQTSSSTSSSVSIINDSSQGWERATTKSTVTNTVGGVTTSSSVTETTDADGTSVCYLEYSDLQSSTGWKGPKGSQLSGSISVPPPKLNERCIRIVGYLRSRSSASLHDDFLYHATGVGFNSPTMIYRSPDYDILYAANLPVPYSVLAPTLLLNSEPPH